MFGTPHRKAVAETASEGAEGHHGHWSILFPDPGEVMGLVAQAAREGAEPETLTELNATRYESHPLPKGEPKSSFISWPSRRHGMLIVVEMEAKSGTNEPAAFYPWLREGADCPARLASIRLWADGLEAQLTVQAGPRGELGLTFFDTLFAAHRVFYKKSGAYAFRFTGFPYTFGLADGSPLVFDDPKAADRMRKALGLTPKGRPGEPLRVDTQGMALLLPRPDLGVADYEFRGPVKAVQETPLDMCGVEAWRLTVTVAKASGWDLDLELCLTRKVLGDAPLPMVGQDVQGVLWLQGHLA